MASISREHLLEWMRAAYHPYENVQQPDGSVLTFAKYDLLPEVHAMFVGRPENLNETIELCGLYDEKLGECRFIDKELVTVEEGLAKRELWNPSTQGANLLQLVKSYAQNAIEQGYETYQYTRECNERERAVQTTLRTALIAVTAYAGVLAARGKETAVLELRDIAQDMWFYWPEPIGSIYDKAVKRMEQQYVEEFDRAVATTRASGQPPAFSAEEARAILRGLSICAEEEAAGDLYSVWRYSRLAKQLWDEYPGVESAFCGNFVVDASERYTKFGSTDSEHLMTISLLNQEVLVFSDPVPEEAVPEGWYCCHLTGRDIVNVDKLVKQLPTQDYVGTVLSPHSLLLNGQQSRQIEWHHRWPDYGDVSLSEYCEGNHLPEPDMSGIFPEQQLGQQLM